MEEQQNCAMYRKGSAGSEIETTSHASMESITLCIDSLVPLSVLKFVFFLYLYSVPTSSETQIMVKSVPPPKKLGADLEAGLGAEREVD